MRVMPPRSANNARARRRHAFLTHVAFNAIVGGGLLAAAYSIWFPPPYLEALGLQELFVGLGLIAVFLCPLLTAILFKPGKKNLAHDMIFIVVFQVILWGGCAYWLAQVRPVYLAALGHRFQIIQAMEMGSEPALPWRGPVVVGTKRAATAQERSQMLFSALRGKDYGHMTQYHAPLSTMREELLSHARDISDLEAYNADKDSISRWLKAQGVTEKNLRFQGASARSKDMTVILDGQNGDFLALAPFRPWID